MQDQYTYLKEVTKGKEVDMDQLHSDLLKYEKDPKVMQHIQLIMSKANKKESPVKTEPIDSNNIHNKYQYKVYDIDTFDKQTLAILQGYMNIKVGRPNL